MNKPKTVYETYKFYLLLFTILFPAAAGLCLLVAILIFALASSIWWAGLLFLIFGLAALGVYWMIRGYIKETMQEEERQAGLRAAREGTGSPAEEAIPEEEAPAGEAEETVATEETLPEEGKAEE